MTKTKKAKIRWAKTVEDAIDDMHMFLDSDMWYASNSEWKSEEDMLKYLRGHFDILKANIKHIREGKYYPFRSEKKASQKGHQ